MNARVLQKIFTIGRKERATMRQLRAIALLFFALVSVATLGYSEREEGLGKRHETRKLLSKRNALKGLWDGSANMLEESPGRGSAILMQIREHAETSLLKKKGGKKKGGKKVRGRKDRKSKSRRKKKGRQRGRGRVKILRRGRKKRRGRRRGRGRKINDIGKSAEEGVVLGRKKMRRGWKKRRGRFCGVSCKKIMCHVKPNCKN